MSLSALSMSFEPWIIWSVRRFCLSALFSVFFSSALISTVYKALGNILVQQLSTLSEQDSDMISDRRSIKKNIKEKNRKYIDNQEKLFQRIAVNVTAVILIVRSENIK